MTRLLKSLPLVFCTLFWVAAPQVATAEGILQAFFSPGEVLAPDRHYYSDDGKYFAVHQKTDNNLVIHKTDGGDFVWGLNDSFEEYSSIALIEMGIDGQLAGFDANGALIWAPPGVVIIEKMYPPKTDQTEDVQTEVAQEAVAQIESPVKALLPASNYMMRTTSYNTIMAQQQSRRGVGTVFDGQILSVHEDGTFEILGQWADVVTQVKPVLSSGLLTMRGQEICSDDNLSSSFDFQGNSLLDLSGMCFSYAEGADYTNAVPKNCTTLSSQEDDIMIILCPQ